MQGQRPDSQQTREQNSNLLLLCGPAILHCFDQCAFRLLQQLFGLLARRERRLGQGGEELFALLLPGREALEPLAELVLEESDLCLQALDRILLAHYIEVHAGQRDIGRQQLAAANLALRVHPMVDYRAAKGHGLDGGKLALVFGARLERQPDGIHAQLDLGAVGGLPDLREPVVDAAHAKL